jgi:SAM-dependent methyltransferase
MEDVISTPPTSDEPRFSPLADLEFEPADCPVCGSTGWVEPRLKVVQGIDVHYGICRECATLYLNPRLTEDSLQTLYDSEEFFEGKEENLNYWSFLAGEEYLRRTARGRLSRIAPFAFGRRLLEVASAAGFFLVEAKEAGYDAEGVEFSKPMAEWASEQWDVPVTAASIEHTELDDEAYDVIASWGVMTIIRDPKALMAKFHAALKPGGVWAFNTYDNRSRWSRLWGNKWYIIVPNTSQIHNGATLRRLLDDAGFDLVATTRDRPYASVERLVFVLMSHLDNSGVSKKLYGRVPVLNKLIIPARAPDAFEYICVKR